MAAVSNIVGDPPPSTKCHLLELPPELRLRIYEYVYDDDFDAKMTSPHDPVDICCGSRPMWDFCGLLRSCRTVNYEARPMLYDSVTFVFPFENFEACRQILQSSGTWTLIRRVRFYVESLEGVRLSFVMENVVDVVNILEADTNRLRTCGVRASDVFIQDVWRAVWYHYEDADILRATALDWLQQIQIRVSELVIDLELDSVCAKLWGSLIRMVQRTHGLADQQCKAIAEGVA